MLRYYFLFFLFLELSPIFAKNELLSKQDFFYLKKNVSRCNFSYVEKFIYDVELIVDEKKCNHGHCPIELLGLYNREPSKKGCLESSFVEVGLKYKEKYFVPFCDFIKYEKSLDEKKSGILSISNEGLCLYKVVNKAYFVEDDSEYKFGVMKTIKDSTNSFVVKNRIGPYCKQGECEMDLVFHSCDEKKCHFSIADRGFLYDSLSKFTIYPLCDFVEIKRSFNSEKMSLGTISATKSGLCELRVLNKSGNYKIPIAIPDDMHDMPKSSKSWKE